MGRKSPWYHPNCAPKDAALGPLTRETPRLFAAELRAGRTRRFRENLSPSDSFSGTELTQPLPLMAFIHILKIL